MGIPLCAHVDAKSERMVFRQTKVIRKPFIHERESAGITSRVARNCASSVCFDSDSQPGKSMAGMLHAEIRLCSTGRQLSKFRHRLDDAQLVFSTTYKWNANC